MAGRRDRLTSPADQRAVVRTVLNARASGAGWKEIAWSLGRSRAQLHRLVRRHESEKCDITGVEQPRHAVA